MLTLRYPAGQLNLVSQTDWKPYPKAVQREAWEKIPPSTRETLIAAAEAVLQDEWKSLPATQFLEFARIGDRANYEKDNFERRNKLIAFALAECVEGQGRFID